LASGVVEFSELRRSKGDPPELREIQLYRC
jgi:hypothetical protein